MLGNSAEADDVPTVPRDGSGVFLLLVGIACCAVLALAALGLA